MGDRGNSHDISGTSEVMHGAVCLLSIRYIPNFTATHAAFMVCVKLHCSDCCSITLSY